MKCYLVLLSLFLGSFSFLQAQTLDTIQLQALSYGELDSMMMLEYNKGNFAGAIPYLKQGVKKAKAEFGSMDSTYSVFLGNLGFFYNQLGQYSDAEKIYLEQITVKKELYGEQHPKYLSALNSLAILYFRMGKYDASESYYKQTIQLSKQHLGEDHATHANALNNLASLYIQIGKFEEAEPIYMQSIGIIKRTAGAEHPDYAFALNNLAYLYYQMAQFESAEPLWLKATAIRKKTVGEQHPDYASSLNNLSKLYQKLGKFEEAEPLMFQAAEIIKASFGEKHPKYATYLSNLASLYESMLRYEEAEPLYQQSIRVAKKRLGVQHPDYASSLNNLAHLYHEIGKYEAAEQLYLEAQKVWEKSVGKTHPDYAISLNNLGSLYSSTGDYTTAIPLYQQCLNIYKYSLGVTHPSYATCLNNMAILYEKMQLSDTAFAYCMASIATNSRNFEAIFPNFFKRTDSHTTAPLYLPHNCCRDLSPKDFLKLSQLDYNSAHVFNKSLFNLLGISKTQGKTSKQKLEAHYNICKAAMQVNEHIRNSFSAKANKLRVLKNNSIFVKYGIDAALMLDDATYYDEAFSFSEQNKSVLLADAVKGNRARVLGDLPDSLVLKEIKLQKKKDQLKKRKAESSSNETTIAITAEENALNQEIDVFLNSLKDKYPKYHHLKYENITVNAKEIQTSLAPKTLLLEYFVTDSMTYLFAISPTSIELFPIDVKKEKLKKQIETLRFALSRYDYIINKSELAQKLYTESAYWFYKEMLSIALQGKEIENLIIITDGELGHLPFEAFLLESIPQGKINYASLPYLVKDYNISYNYSATLWKENLEIQQNRKQTNNHNNHQMFACAASYPKVDSSLLDLRLPNIFDMRHSLVPLPQTKTEIKTLSKVFDGLFLTNDSTSEAFFKEHAHEYGVIHLAMHGLLHPRVPMLSSLAFTENKDSLEDNFLQAHEVAHLHLNADLVVLSACETGYGKFEQGEGIVSLARSFMYAGTPSLVVSLWQVNDQSTSVIMNYFYHYIADGMPKDVALRQAKLDYLTLAKDFAGHPAFWSAFIQLGDTTSVKISRRRNYSTWGIGIGILVGLSSLIAIFVALRKKKELV
ncbi:CHAT domain-containing tetratricopeptide repeat protein [Aureispira sp. CCB-E]|uniref:CHAT domain-containing protein n=1 Tax=Aureispira sp. CCB-E TaxID=3051121 RepID=UPI002868C9E8|nr:CHAT domain-containing tetratricopeptide repeat protein [Aureispira sp. CCB-E]WMX17406.1 CHAT domain-containing tetratricopeptide repeat protein [Aureispira sp. CCB-E]